MMMARQSAQVTSLDALLRFKASMCQFDEEVRVRLASAESDVRRTLWWLQNELPGHWQREIRKRQKELAMAKSELVRAELASREQRASCVLERRAVEKAKHRLEEAESKLERTRHWVRVLERESLLYQGQMQGLSARLERDVPKALARLDALLGHLRAYVSTAPPSENDSAAQEHGTSMPDPSRRRPRTIREHD